MRKTYNSTNKKLQADQYRRDADECHRAGFPMFAEVNWAMGQYLDPPVSEEYED